MIQFVDIPATHNAFLRDYFKELQQLFTTCDFIGASSKTAAQFECQFAGYIGAKYAIGVASGTDALLLPLHAVGVGPGDEVILPAYGFIASADVVVRLGGRPVFIDVDPISYNMDPARLEAAITDRTKAIMPVHLFGQACNMDPIMEIANRRGIPVIEDVAQACGAEYGGKKLGNIGAFGGFSFYPTKNLGGAGDGGAITTNDDALAEKLYKFRDHGRNKSGAFEIIGYNSRLDTIQSLYLAHKLEDLDDSIMDRIENARLYNQLFEGSEIVTPAVPDDMSHSFNLYTIRVRDRDRLQTFLREKQVATAVYYKEPMHMTPALAGLGYKPGDFPISEKSTSEVLQLPVYPGLKKREIETVAQLVLEFLNNNVAAIKLGR
ncbi:MAG: DegT/DnrJ/EryC1/StrS family aminotransferase [Candidatus Sumerlaeaceae bacterium]|nr:DegT/DnrJ/EryC1/StrS family aminotransferase [Candidatus Sumerlaeaceae bacterium]